MSQKAVLVGVNLKGRTDFEKSMRELALLADSCGIEPVGEITQNRETANATSYIGAGKIPEILPVLAATDAELVIFNDELTPSQLRNLENALHCGILDRTGLILEIFARRAKTREAKLQVEVANLKYSLPRLVGLRKSLEQQTGGVGTRNRGAGEKMLELNRRQIQDRISRLEDELSQLAELRQTQRRQRTKEGIPVVSLVGYTNAGKSTIMNAFLDLCNQPEEKKVYAQNMLFATLETSVRAITLEDNKSFLLTDTVGFISELPHHLVKAFRSTLEEVLEADLLIHVVDCSDPDCRDQIAVTEQTLRDLGADKIPVIYAFNKADRMDIRPPSFRAEEVYLSAVSGAGLDDLLKLIRKHIFEDYTRCEMLIPYSQGDVTAYLNDHAQIFSTAYEAEGTRLLVELRQADYNRLQQYVTETRPR